MHLFDNLNTLVAGLNVASLEAFFHFKIEGSSNSADFFHALIGTVGALKHFLGGIISFWGDNRSVESTILKIV